MHPDVARSIFFVKEHVGMFKAANQYDVLDPDTQQILFHCREPHLGLITKFLRFTDYKRMTPFHVEVTTPGGEPIVSVKRGVSFIRSTVKVFDENEQHIGSFKQKLFSIGGKFTVLDTADKPLCTLKGKWTSWDFKFLADDGSELASVSKEWAGMAKEMFTSADNYVLRISPDVPGDHPVRLLILAAVMCIDMVLKE